ILYAFVPEKSLDPTEFAVDLSKESSPNQLVLAYIPRKGTLAETLEDLKKKMEQEPSERVSFKLQLHQLEEWDALLVPTMHWRILHHFHELEGADKPIENTGPLSGTWLEEAFQTLEFKLDRSGATIRSDSMGRAVLGGHWPLHFNRPFLLYMKKRGAKHPFFVVLVVNSEFVIK